MGLDIYFHVGRGKDYNSVYASEKERQHKNLRTAIKRNVNKIVKNSNETTYKDDTIAMIKSLAPKYYGYDWGYDHVIRKFDEAPVAKDKLVDFLVDNLVPCTYVREDAYFRKVNFIYAYFSDRLEDEMCEVTTADIEDIISRCDKVIKDHNLAQSLLPTCSGFFFGSTTYDDWYIYDVKDCRKKMQKLLKRMKKEPESNCFVYFSW